jgi:hypothetical protein
MDKVSKGILWVLIGHVSAFIVGIAVTMAIGNAPLKQIDDVAVVVSLFWISLIYLIQIIYVLPLAVLAKFKNQPETFKGILIAAGVTFALSGLTCAGMSGVYRIPGR